MSKREIDRRQTFLPLSEPAATVEAPLPTKQPAHAPSVPGFSNLTDKALKGETPRALCGVTRIAKAHTVSYNHEDWTCRACKKILEKYPQLIAVINKMRNEKHVG